MTDFLVCFGAIFGFLWLAAVLIRAVFGWPAASAHEAARRK